MTVTQTHEETAFQIGWNLLRFDFSGKTTTGTPVDTACDFASIFMTKTAGKINQTGFYIDQISLKKGQVYQLAYYSKYPWVNTSGTYIENSTSDSDYLVANSDEVELYVRKAIEFAAQEVAEDNIDTGSLSKYEAMKKIYEGKNVDKSKLMQTTYYTF